MSLLNGLVHAADDAGISQLIYNAFFVLSFVSWLFFNHRHGAHYGLSVRERTVISLVVFPVAYASLYVLYWIETAFNGWGSHNIVRGFVYFPLIALALAKFLHIRRGVAVDFIAPGVSLCQGVAHLGCSFAGCCYGIPFAGGIWNPRFGSYLFPVQICEAAAALLTFAVCAVYAKKRGYRGDGTVYPLFLILFGVTRFFLEFLRDNQKVIGQVSVLALHAALMVLVGTVWLLVHARRASSPTTAE